MTRTRYTSGDNPHYRQKPKTEPDGNSGCGLAFVAVAALVVVPVVLVASRVLWFVAQQIGGVL